MTINSTPHLSSPTRGEEKREGEKGGFEIIVIRGTPLNNP
jgi:hypothetical protein